jgi:hypothetical protein
VEAYVPDTREIVRRRMTSTTRLAMAATRISIEIRQARRPATDCRVCASPLLDDAVLGLRLSFSATQER